MPVFSQVDILRQDPEKEEVEPEEVEPDEPVEEPLMDSLAMSAPTPEPALNLEISALDLALGRSVPDLTIVFSIWPWVISKSNR